MGLKYHGNIKLNYKYFAPSGMVKDWEKLELKRSPSPSIACPCAIVPSPRNETSGFKRCVFVSTLLGAIRPDKDADCTS